MVLLLTVEIRVGLLLAVKTGLLPEIGFSLFCLQFPYRKQKRQTVSKKTSTVSSKRRIPFGKVNHQLRTPTPDPPDLLRFTFLSVSQAESGKGPQNPRI